MAEQKYLLALMLLGLNLYYSSNIFGHLQIQASIFDKIVVLLVLLAAVYLAIKIFFVKKKEIE